MLRRAGTLTIIGACAPANSPSTILHRTVTDPKRHHWVPECYLRAWWDPASPIGKKPHVWRIDRTTRTGEALSVDQVFVKTHLYTFRKSDGSRDFEIEKTLSKVETAFSRVMRDKVTRGKPISIRDRAWLTVFTATMLARTLAQRDNVRQQWKRAVEIGEDMERALKSMTPEQRQRVAGLPRSSTDKTRSLTLDQVRDLVAQPLQHTVPPMTVAATDILSKMGMAILTTKDELGFISSDNPCAIHDPTAYRRPPIHRSPGLGHESAEVTLPLSPNHLLIFTWLQAPSIEYLPLKGELVDELNRRTQFFSSKHLICRKNESRDHWFKRGEIPPDAWENSDQARKLARAKGAPPSG
jgi:hypothetical protein